MYSWSAFPQDLNKSNANSVQQNIAKPTIEVHTNYFKLNAPLPLFYFVDKWRENFPFNAKPKFPIQIAKKSKMKKLILKEENGRYLFLQPFEFSGEITIELQYKINQDVSTIDSYIATLTARMKEKNIIVLHTSNLLNLNILNKDKFGKWLSWEKIINKNVYNESIFISIVKNSVFLIKVSSKKNSRIENILILKTIIKSIKY